MDRSIPRYLKKLALSRWTLLRARGEPLCSRWRSFERFYQDVGDPPGKGLKLMRIRQDRPYSPANYRWVTSKGYLEGDRPVSISVLHDGKPVARSVVAAELGCSPATLTKRLQKYRGNGVETVTLAELKRLTRRYRQPTAPQ